MDSIQALLKQRDLKVSGRTVSALVTDIDRAGPWFAASGDLTLDFWEELGQDLKRAQEENKLNRGTMPIWRLEHSYLRDDP